MKPPTPTIQQVKGKGKDKALGFQEIKDPRIFRHSAHAGGKAVFPTHWSPLSRGYIPDSTPEP